MIVVPYGLSLSIHSSVVGPQHGLFEGAAAFLWRHSPLEFFSGQDVDFIHVLSYAIDVRSRQIRGHFSVMGYRFLYPQLTPPIHLSRKVGRTRILLVGGE